jgi:hypothetical protein
MTPGILVFSPYLLIKSKDNFSVTVLARAEFWLFGCTVSTPRWSAGCGPEPAGIVGRAKTKKGEVSLRLYLTASYDQTARVWDIPTITREDSANDANLLADLAEATGGRALQAFGQTEILIALTQDQVKATRDKIAVKFPGPPSQLAPLQRFLKWSVSDRSQRTISPLSKLTFPEWIENRIKEGTIESLRAAIQMDPANARLVRWPKKWVLQQLGQSTKMVF